eukprot:scaffold1531_cov296-Prasinococcus_capsulatus_cf.AAC.4
MRCRFPTQTDALELETAVPAQPPSLRWGPIAAAKHNSGPSLGPGVEACASTDANNGMAECIGLRQLH